MTLGVRRSLAGEKVIHVNVGWTLWLLLVQPGEAVRRFVHYQLGWLAVVLVIVTGASQGALVAASLRPYIELAQLLGVASLPSPVQWVSLGMVSALAVWGVTTSLVWLDLWLVERPVAWSSLASGLGTTTIPWLTQTVLIPLALVNRGDTLGSLTLMSLPLVGIWWLWLLRRSIMATTGMSPRMSGGVILFTLCAWGCLAMVGVTVSVVAVGLTMSGGRS